MSKKLLTLVYWLVVFCITQSAQTIAHQAVAPKNNEPQTTTFFKLVRKKLERHCRDICKRHNKSIIATTISCKDNTDCKHPFILTTGNKASAQLKGTSLIDLLGDLNNHPLRLRHPGRFAVYTYQFLSSPNFLRLTQQSQFELPTYLTRIPIKGIDNTDNKTLFNTKVILARTAG